MKDLSLYILDIVQNSIAAKAKNIHITIVEEDENTLTAKITDDGCGMDAATLADVKNAFRTSRTTRSVGLGVPFLTMAAEQTGGSVVIDSKHKALFPADHGTTVMALFYKNHIDCPPVGDMTETVALLIYTNPEVDFIFQHKTSSEVVLDTKELRRQLDGLPLNNPDVYEWIKSYLTEFYEQTKG